MRVGYWSEIPPYKVSPQRSLPKEEAHSTVLASGEKTCIDCHKGIAHELPDMEGVEGW